MSERLIKDPEIAKSGIGKDLLTHLSKAQSSSRDSSQREQAVRAFEAALESSRYLWPLRPKEYFEAISTMRIFLETEHLGVLDAVRVWSNHGQINNALHSLAVFDYIRSSGIKKEAMDFLALGLPLYERSLQSAE